MSERTRRLERLCSLRERLADAAGAERGHAEYRAGVANEALRTLRVGMAEASCPTQAGASWWEQRAAIAVATHQEKRLVLEVEARLCEREHLVAAERAAVEAREQIRGMRDRAVASRAVEQSRREQMQLDDLFLTARVRREMTTSF